MFYFFLKLAFVFIVVIIILTAQLWFVWKADLHWFSLFHLTKDSCSELHTSARETKRNPKEWKTYRQGFVSTRQVVKITSCKPKKGVAHEVKSLNMKLMFSISISTKTVSLKTVRPCPFYTGKSLLSLVFPVDSLFSSLPPLIPVLLITKHLHGLHCLTFITLKKKWA